MEQPETGFARASVIPFALDAAGAWRDVDEVPRGLACACFCPACKGKVVARQGDQRIHHFAHSDRKECRHALESSLFGMAISILSEPGTRLATPPIGNREQLARETNAQFTPGQAAKFFATDWVIPSGSATVTDSSIAAVEIGDSNPETPDLRIGTPAIDVHLISYRKTPAKVIDVIKNRDLPVLALDLRAYAKIWWATCDANKDAKVRQATQARDLMKRWLGERQTGRTWVFHPEFEAKKKELLVWVGEQAAKRKEDELKRAKAEAERAAKLEFERQEAIARIRAQHARSPWRIPESNPLGDTTSSAPSTADAPPPLMMVALRPAIQPLITKFLAADLGLVWHQPTKSWVYVGSPPGVVPLPIRQYLDQPMVWEQVPPDQTEELRPSVPHAPLRPTASTQQMSVAPRQPGEEGEGDRVLRAAVGVCSLCGAPTDELLFGGGMFAGKTGLVCSKMRRHPMKIY